MNDDQGGYLPAGERRIGARGRRISWIAGILGIALVIAFAVWLSHRGRRDVNDR